MNFIGFFGDFILRENENPKIFIATGTGLAPIYRMMNASKKTIKQLHISVATKDEVFYRDELEKIPNLEVFYYISREKVENFLEGRINFDNIKLEKNSEIYMCGNPKMIEDFSRKFSEKNVKNIFFEEFTV